MLEEDINTNDFIEFHKILGVQMPTSTYDIKTKYNQLVKQYHPDRCKLPNANEITAKINHAYDILNQMFEENIYLPVYQHINSLNAKDNSKTVVASNNVPNEQKEHIVPKQKNTKTTTNKKQTISKKNKKKGFSVIITIPVLTSLIFAICCISSILLPIFFLVLEDILYLYLYLYATLPWIIIFLISILLDVLKPNKAKTKFTITKYLFFTHCFIWTRKRKLKF